MKTTYELVVIGGSAGSFDVLLNALPKLGFVTDFAIVLVLHRNQDAHSSLAEVLGYEAALPVKEAEEKEEIRPGTIYLAPPDYHLLIEKSKTFSLDYSEKINFSRPAIDLTFQTAAEAYGDKLACVLLSGSNADGSMGLKAVNQLGGHTAVQNPETCDIPFMPNQALKQVQVDSLVDGDQLAEFIQNIHS